MDFLRERAYNEILVEAGPTLAGAMLKEGWVDRLVVYQAPKLLGDAARPMASWQSMPLLSNRAQHHRSDPSGHGSAYHCDPARVIAH